MRACAETSIRLTLFRNEGGRPLAKAYTLDGAGTLTSKIAAQMAAGTFERLEVDHIDDFAGLLTDGQHGPDCALAYGVNAAPKGYVAALAAIRDGNARHGAIPRTAEHFPFRVVEPGILFLDIDPLPGQEHQTAFDYDRIFCSVVTWWEETRRFYIPSSSSGIYAANGTLVSRKTAFHCHLTLDDASQAKAVTDALFVALIDAGHGQVVISKSGARLLRTIIDRAVPQGERLDFAFGGRLGKGLTQERHTTPMGHVAVLATQGKGRDDFDAWRTSSPVVRELMRLAEPEAKATEAAWVDERVEDAVSRGADPKSARCKYGCAASHGELPDDLILFTGDGEPVPVDEVRANPGRWDRATFRDPLEPDYAGGHPLAIAYLLGQNKRPVIHSQAHGGRTYWLKAGSAKPAMLALPPPQADDAPSGDVVDAEPQQTVTDGNNVLQVDFAPATDDGKPVIKIWAGGLAIMADKAEKHLIAAGVPFYTRGETLVRPIVEREMDSIGNAALSAAMVEVTPAYLRDMLCREIAWKSAKADKKSGAVEWVPSHPPKDVVETVMSRRGEWTFKPLAGVISTPTLRPDGSILDKPGYDEATKLYLISTVKLPVMPDTPTRRDAERALNMLDELLDEFPFVMDDDGASPSRSVALSLLITPTVRGAMDVVPAHVARAATSGTGKSYLLDTAAAIAIGSTCPVMTAGKTEEETEKRIGSKALAGHSIINIDNVNGELGGDNLCQIVERPICEIRVLGRSSMPRVVNRFCVFATGNNIQLVGDMTRRALICSMDAAMERPADRAFRGDPVRTVLRNRGAYIAACLTVIRAYIAAGRPRQECVPMASFKLWSDTVRSALLWLGRADPCDTIKTARDEDPELQKLTQFLGAMRNEVGVGREWSVFASDLQAKAEYMTTDMDEEGRPVGHKYHKHPELKAALDEWTFNGKLNTRSLGKWMNSKKMRVVDGHRLACFEDRNRKVLRWYVERVETPQED
jgi:putative DNA primase/helicase